MVKIVIFGGTFDPVHMGHLALAERVRSDMAVTKVIFVPANKPPHKTSQRVTSGRHRLNMLKEAIKDNPGFEVSEVELLRDGPSYTVDTMRYFAALYPKEQLFFLMGMDSLLELDTWKDVDIILDLCHLLVVTRPGYTLDRGEERFKRLPLKLWERTRFLTMPGLDIASREIRERIREGKSVRYLIPEGVLKYIEENDIYRDSE